MQALLGTAGASLDRTNQLHSGHTLGRSLAPRALVPQ